MLSKTSTSLLAMIMTPVPGGTVATMLPLGAKLSWLLAMTLLLIDAADLALFGGQVGHGEDQNSAGIVGRQVVVDVGPGRVFDLDAGHVFLDGVAADDDILRLADVDAGVGSARDFAVFDHDALAEDRIDAVAAVGFLGTAGPLGADLAKRNLGRAVGLDPITAGVFDGEAFEGDVVLAGDRADPRRRFPGPDP